MKIIGFRVIGVTDLEHSWKELAFGLILKGRRKAWRLCRIPFTGKYKGRENWTMVYERKENG